MRQPPTAACLLLSLVLVGCDAAPPKSADPAAGAAARQAEKHHELQSAIDSVDQREKAEHAADPVMEADKAHDQQLEDAGG
jgi:hypothetical protein